MVFNPQCFRSANTWSIKQYRSRRERSGKLLFDHDMGRRRCRYQWRIKEHGENSKRQKAPRVDQKVVARGRRIRAVGAAYSEKALTTRRIWMCSRLTRRARLRLAAPLLRFPKGLPPSVDLRSECPPIYDQGQLGSCTANGIAGAIEFDQRKQGNREFTPSRLFIYYNERVIEGTVTQDSGAQVRDGIKSVAALGAPPETDWPYDVQKFAQKPPALAYTDAKQDLVASYARVPQVLLQMQGCLAEGYPFVFGFTVYESFESQDVANSGIVPMPTSGEKVVGGHCVVAVGYDDSKRVFMIRNSWGTDWGIKGYCTMPYEYLLRPNLAADFWTM
jgi:C1A family cysteine protease